MVPCFRWQFFIDMSSSETPGSSSAAGTQFLRRCRWPSTCRNGLGTSHGPHPPILVGSPISGLDYGSLSFTTCRFARPPVGADQVFTQPTGTFTSGLPTVWSPSPPPDITTAVTGQVPLAGLSPARTPTSIAAIPQPDSNEAGRAARRGARFRKRALQDLGRGRAKARPKVARQARRYQTMGLGWGCRRWR